MYRNPLTGLIMRLSARICVIACAALLVFFENSDSPKIMELKIILTNAFWLPLLNKCRAHKQIVSVGRSMTYERAGFRGQVKSFGKNSKRTQHK